MGGIGPIGNPAEPAKTHHHVCLALEAANRIIAQLREDLATAKGAANVSVEDAKHALMTPQNKSA
jgi:hypothetical protein